MASTPPINQAATATQASKDAFVVNGGAVLRGEITPQGAKNEALQILAAVTLSAEPISVENLPDIKDINAMIALLKSLGVSVQKHNNNHYTFCAKDINFNFLEQEGFSQQTAKLRGSVLLLGPMLGRFGRAFMPRPGGDKIGRRPLDTHIKGMEALGAAYHYNEKQRAFTLTAPSGGLTGSYMLLEEASVTGTANVVMAAVLAKGTTTIYNAACEPYVQQLCQLLNQMGAKISGIGSNLLSIQGVEKLGAAKHRILPDMLEIGSFIGLAAITGGDIRIKNCRVDKLGIIPNAFRKLGIDVIVENDDIHIPKHHHYQISTFMDGSILTLYDHPWPGLSPDLLSIMLVVATQARGSVLIHQKMFESRLFFVDKLIDMGAQIILCDPHRAVVIGLDHQYPLRGLTMSSPDIRAGIALLIAALSAKGKSTINNAHQIDRGYQNIAQRLQKLGADIERI